MKHLNSKLAAAIVAGCLLFNPSERITAQDNLSEVYLIPDTTITSELTGSTISSEDDVKPEKVRRWDKRQHQHYKGWERIKPTHFKMQYAGGMGVLSTGFGWDYGKRCQWETDVFMGYLPKKYASKFRLTFTLKQNYIPWSMSFDEHWNLEPFYCGLYFTTIAGEEFWSKEPGRYPNHYYNISTKIRPSIFIGQRMGFSPHLHLLKNIQLWYEVGTNELYLISKITNKSLTMKDILRFSFGLKLQLFNDQKAKR